MDEKSTGIVQKKGGQENEQNEEKNEKRKRAENKQTDTTVWCSPQHVSMACWGVAVKTCLVTSKEEIEQSHPPRWPQEERQEQKRIFLIEQQSGAF